MNSSSDPRLPLRLRHSITLRYLSFSSYSPTLRYPSTLDMRRNERLFDYSVWKRDARGAAKIHPAALWRRCAARLRIGAPQQWWFCQRYYQVSIGQKCLWKRWRTVGISKSQLQDDTCFWLLRWGFYQWDQWVDLNLWLCWTRLTDSHPKDFVRKITQALKETGGASSEYQAAGFWAIKAKKHMRNITNPRMPVSE